jgi:mRNA interferase HigB
MLIDNITLIDDFAFKHAEAANALQAWVNVVGRATWTSHNDLKATFPSADYVGAQRYVFNIRGNNYRLVAIVVFSDDRLWLRFIGTHQEYDKINCKTI